MIKPELERVILSNLCTYTDLQEVVSEEDFGTKAGRETYKAIRRMVGRAVEKKSVLPTLLEGEVRSKEGKKLVDQLAADGEMLTREDMELCLINLKEMTRWRRQVEALSQSEAKLVKLYGQEVPFEEATTRVFDELLAVWTGGQPAGRRISDVLADMAFPKPRDLDRFPTGIEELDVLLDLRRRELLVVGAAEGVGKTALLSWMALMNVQEGRNVLFASLDMSAEFLAARLMAPLVGVSHYKLRDGMQYWGDMEEKVKPAMEKLANIRVVGGAQVRISLLKALQRFYKFDLILIDYFTLLSTTQPFRQRYDRFSMLAERLRAWTNEGDFLLVVASQLNKERMKRAEERPLLTDLREGAPIAQAADAVLFITGSPDGSERQLWIEKNRNRGPRRDAVLVELDGAKMTFSNR